MSHIFKKKITKELAGSDYLSQLNGWELKREGDNREYIKKNNKIFFFSGDRGYKLIVFDGNKTAFTHHTAEKKEALIFLNEAIMLW